MNCVDVVYFFLSSSDNYVAKEKLTAHNAAVISLDWSLDNKNIQSVCLGYELLFRMCGDFEEGGTLKRVVCYFEDGGVYFEDGGMVL